MADHPTEESESLMIQLAVKHQSDHVIVTYSADTGWFFVEVDGGRLGSGRRLAEALRDA